MWADALTSEPPVWGLGNIGKVSQMYTLMVLKQISHENVIYSVVTIVTNTVFWDFLGGPMVKNPPAHAGDMGSIPGPGRFHTLRSN